MDHNELLEITLPQGKIDRGGKDITIRLANGDGDRDSANMLINRRYSARGYGSHHTVPQAENCATFTASSRGSLIGTLSLTVDGPTGLAADTTFKDELDAFRAGGSRICELTRFAFETSRPALGVLAALFHIIFIYGTQRHDCTDLFIEVARRHRRFYELMLGFRQVGSARINDSVKVQSHLMRLRVSDIRRHIDEHTIKRCAASHSLYPFFFSPSEEVGIQMRLCGKGCAVIDRRAKVH
jgi:hypothetical protein